MQRIRTLAAAGALALATTGLLVPSAASSVSAASPGPQTSPRPGVATAPDDGSGTAPARAAISRLAPDLASRFVLRLEPDDTDAFTIARQGGHIALSGTDNAALVSAFSRYLEEFAGGQIARGPDHIPDVAPLPDHAVSVESPYQYRYINNFTVGGYTSPNWHWSDWQAEIDLMAAHGVNMALVTVGQEAVWRDTFQDFGYSDEEIRNWIVPTSHQPWQWMGNIERDDSGLTDELIERRAALGRKIIDRMREMGITPVVPGYGGIVPPGFAERNPGAHVVPQGDWHDYRRPDWLDTTSSTYADVAASYYRHQRERFGALHAQAIDLLHEGGASGDVPLDEAAQGIEQALAAADPDYLWVIQAWQQNPRKEIVDAVDTEHMLVLDLTHGQWQQTDAFHGAPWAWGELGNFGGRLGLFGHLDDIAQDLPAAVASADSGDLRGIALMHEGLEQDPIVEQLWSRMSWQAEPIDLDAWIGDYVESRYGIRDADALAAWRLLADAAYQVTDSRRADSVLNAEPDLNATRAAQRQPNRLPYDPAVIEQALVDLLQVSPRLRSVDAYRYDVVDVARQVIVNRGREVLPEVKAAYLAADRAAFERTSEEFLDLLRAEERLLSTRPEFLFGTWVEDARSWGTTPTEARTLVESAKRLVTTWALTRSGFDNLKEYANRDWAGLVSGYYLPRWRLYFSHLSEALRTGADPAPIDWFEYGNSFTNDTATTYATRPRGSSLAEAEDIAADLLGVRLDAPATLHRSDSATATVTVRNVRPDQKLSGTLTLDVPAGWDVRPRQVDVAPIAPGEETTVEVDLTVAADAEYGLHPVRATLTRDDLVLRDVVDVQVVRRSIAEGKEASQSSTGWGGTPDKAVDGITDGDFNHGSVTHTATQNQPWWQVDLGATHPIDQVTVWNRTDCCSERLHDFYVLVSDEPFTSDSLTETLAQPGVTATHYPDTVGTNATVDVDHPGRYVRIQLAADATPLSLAEVQVFEPEP